MFQLTKEDLQYLSKLVFLELDSSEEELLLKNLEKVISYINESFSIELDSIEDLGKESSFVSIEDLREDEVSSDLSREVFLKETPESIAGLVKVPSVIKSQN